MSWSQHIKHPSQLLHVGQEVNAKVLNIESEEKKISLGLKQLEPDPWENIDEKYPLNSKHNGVVRNLTQFGAFVELEEGIDGLVHISDLSWTKKIRHPSEVVKKGDEIEVIVLGINRDERRIALGHKQIDENPWDVFEDTYKVDTETEGKVARIIDKGVIVTLPMGVDGFIPMTHLGHPKLKKATEYYNIGDDIPAKVIEFDKENKKIVLSVTNYFKGKEDKELAQYLSGHGVEKTTLQDIVKDVPEDLAKEEKPAAEKKTSAKKKEDTDKETAVAPEAEKESKEKVKAETEDAKKTDEPKAKEVEPKAKDKKDVAPEPAVEEKAEETAPVEEKAEAKDEVSEEEVKAADKEEKPVKEKKTKAKKETKPATEKKTKTTAKKTTTKKKEAAADTKEEKSK